MNKMRISARIETIKNQQIKNPRAKKYSDYTEDFRKEPQKQSQIREGKKIKNKTLKYKKGHLKLSN